MNTLSYTIADALNPQLSNILHKLFESKEVLNEGARIDHAEDIIFWEGSKGAKRVLQSFLDLEKQGYKNLTIKWDGSPAVIFGRNQDGQFILTDKAGFVAKGYNGKVTSGEDLEKMFLARGGGSPKSDEYKAFAGQMKSVFDVFKSAIPENVRGYFKGDLLYFTKPSIQNNQYVFKPNIVTYQVDANSELGQKIAKSVSGVVVHSFNDESGTEMPVKDLSVFQGEKLLVIPPVTIQQPPKIDTAKIKQVLSLITNSGASIDKMLDDATLSSLKLSDFKDILYKYINSKVDSGLSDLGKDFEKWIATGAKLTEVKRQRLLKYIEDNRQAFNAMWDIVGGIMDIKESIIKDIDQQPMPVKAFIGNVPSGEGYVLSHPEGSIKFVSRPTFSAANRAIQRETIANYDFDIPQYQRELIEGGWLRPELTAKTKITPQVVKSVLDVAKKFVKEFNVYLTKHGFENIGDVKILGSAKYFEKDIEDKNDVTYGDIDVMFVLPEADDESQETKIKTMYSKLIMDFVQTSGQNYVDIDSVLESRGTQLVVKINDTEWVQIDLLYTFKKYDEWFAVRFSPQRGLKGFVSGNLYSALASVLDIRIGDRGVRAKMKNGKIVAPLLRKDVIDKLITARPSTFLLDIYKFLCNVFDIKPDSSHIDSDLNAYKGINPDDIKFENLAKGIAGLARTLDNAGILAKLDTNYKKFTDDIKAEYDRKTAKNIEKKSEKTTDDDTQKNLDRIKRDSEIGQNLVNKIINEFTQQFKEYIEEGANAVATNSSIPRQFVDSTVKNALKIYGLDSIKYEIVGNRQKEISGDIDVATDSNGIGKIIGASYDVDKKEFFKKLEEYIKSRIPSGIPQPAYKMMQGLDQVSINIPIVDEKGKQIKSVENPDDNAYAQLDLMIGDVDFMGKSLSGSPNSKYKAVLRNLLLMNIMRYSYEPTADPATKTRYQFNWKKGLQKLDVVTNIKGKEEKKNIKTISNNMDDVAVFLFGNGHTFNDINTFEKLFKLVNSDAFRYKKYKDEIINDFKVEIAKLGYEL